MAMSRDVVVLSDEQFGKLVELLTPGYEVALAYKAQMDAELAKRAQYEAKEIASAEEAKERGRRSDSERGGEGDNMGQGSGGAPDAPYVPPPAPDDPSKQGSG